MASGGRAPRRRRERREPRPPAGTASPARPARLTAARPLVVAHRGAWGAAPQNSLAALETAIELGCDMVELDVRVTRDRRLVVIHDARAGAGVGALVSTLTLAELRGRLAPGQAPGARGDDRAGGGADCP